MGSVHLCTRFSSLFDVPCVKINLTKSHITRKVGGRLTRKQTFNINELSFENWNTSKHVGHTPSSHGKFVSLSIKILISRFVVAGPTASVFWDGPITMKISHLFLLIQVYKKKNAKRMNRKRENDLSNTSTTCSLHVIGIWQICTRIQFIHLLYASERESHQRLRTHCVELKIIIIERFCSCMDLLDFIKILVQISRTWPAKLIRVTWRRLRLQILMWELEGLDPQYVVPTDIYPIHY